MDDLAALRRGIDETFTQAQPLVDQRRAQGFVRECHGDLHLGNLVRWQGEVFAIADADAGGGGDGLEGLAGDQGFGDLHGFGEGEVAAHVRFLFLGGHIGFVLLGRRLFRLPLLCLFIYH